MRACHALLCMAERAAPAPAPAPAPASAPAFTYEYGQAKKSCKGQGQLPQLILCQRYIYLVEFKSESTIILASLAAAAAPVSTVPASLSACFYRYSSTPAGQTAVAPSPYAVCLPCHRHDLPNTTYATGKISLKQAACALKALL
jgi:hypothetical protein